MTHASFSTSAEDAKLIRLIVDRAMEHRGAVAAGLDRMCLSMDITAAHCNGNPLRLLELLNADAFNFTHDVFGIVRHIDRETGKLGGCFRPRFTQRNADPSAAPPVRKARAANS
jgi:hypothetical protein